MHEALVIGLLGSDDPGAGAFDIVAKLLAILPLLAATLKYYCETGEVLKSG
jgi:hypothetical protein